MTISPGVPPPASERERRRPFTLPELIDIAGSSNPVTRDAWNDARNAAFELDGQREGSLLFGGAKCRYWPETYVPNCQTNV
ncbi:MAG: hypothetical protein WA858_17195 [Xanthobacteraceae bacterium]